MAGRPHTLTAAQSEWVIKSAWKKLTLQEIALRLDVNVLIVKRLLDLYDLSPVTKRDQVTSQILDIYNDHSRPFPKNAQLATELGCSQIFIKSIIDDLGIISTTEKNKKGIKKSKQAIIPAEKLDAFKEYEQRMEAQRELRKTFTSYTQSSSDLIDHCRQMHTTLRPSTYLTNN